MRVVEKLLTISYIITSLCRQGETQYESGRFDNTQYQHYGKDIPTNNNRSTHTTNKERPAIDYSKYDKPQSDWTEKERDEWMRVHGITVGIDLGTTFSCVYVYDPHRKGVSHLKVDFKDTVPSVLKYNVVNDDNGGVKLLSLVGYPAIAANRKEPEPDNYFYAFKRFIGLGRDDVEKKSLDMANINRHVTYKVDFSSDPKNSGVVMLCKDKNNNLLKEVSSIEASTEVLTKIYNEVKRLYEGRIRMCVVTVPAYFTENQVISTRNAAMITGLPNVLTMNEPVAAAYCYQVANPQEEDCIKLVFDMGGGTLDISIVEYDDQFMMSKIYAGDNYLGGENVNDELYKHFLSEITRSGEAMTTSGPVRLREFVEKFKIALCDKQNSLGKGEDAVHSDTFNVNSNLTLNFTMKTSEFDRICAPVFDRVAKYLSADKAEGILCKYKDNLGDPKDIKKVLFVGGSSRIPAIRKLLSDTFPHAEMNYSLDADKCVAQGAALYAAKKCELLGQGKDITLVDVISMPIGICVGENEFVAILDQHQSIPAKGDKIFTTSVDMQKRVSIKVAQGLRFGFSDNKYLGEFELEIDQPAPKGVPQIQVALKMDKDRVLEVTARDTKSDKSANIVFNRSNHDLSNEEINRMKAEREAKKAEDDMLRIRYEARNKLDSYMDAVQQRLMSPNVKDDVRVKVDKALQDAKAWFKNNKDSATTEMILGEFENLKNTVEPLLTGAEKEPKPEYEKPTQEKVREEL
ncbi:hypothetical protein EDEG_03347 [Edhazardia aedis USNM 41457]|uniref:Chaperone DnaK n=1 Tax=Edhazardia aedis (strain USNM 41457) TaxID=1003232 RepID=J9D3V9_EDHAE|nr:hypothetical protein EDEG_03347 [Edhazardia aedis USNM 41457]|eukprot:EJW02229.1 hypothetical protein EDEG_03347 [Edhazardia aedis USNM 41457]